MKEQTVLFDYSKSYPLVQPIELELMQPAISMAHDLLQSKSGPGSEFLGWIDWPITYDQQEFSSIKLAAEKIIAKSDILLVIGIGGSYWGSKAALDMLNHTFYNKLSRSKRLTPEIYYVGHQLSATYLNDLLEILDDKEISVNVISKSGLTTEPAIAFRIIREYMERRYGKAEAKERIYATTDKEHGALKQIAKLEGYQTFSIPDEIGGRFSALTAVGLLPMAVSGINIDEMMAGAQQAYKHYLDPSLDQNPCYQYAAMRNILYRKGKTIELLVNYEPSLTSFSEWWKQLFGESEGKQHKGIFPASVHFTTDLHSLGQYIQDGLRHLFETVIQIEEVERDYFIAANDDNLDGLNYLTGKSLSYINQRALEGTMLAHTDGGVPNLIIQVPQLNPYYFGQLVYFFEKACGISGYLLGVNPFDQPGVEAYKKNMFALLGKPGYEKEKEELEKRLLISG